jgi:hypothetical protein
VLGTQAVTQRHVWMLPCPPHELMYRDWHHDGRYLTPGSVVRVRVVALTAEGWGLSSPFTLVRVPALLVSAVKGLQGVSPDHTVYTLHILSWLKAGSRRRRESGGPFLQWR